MRTSQTVSFTPCVRIDVRTVGRVLLLSPQYLSNRPRKKAPMDPISDVFKTMQVASVVHARLEATAPWGLMREAEAEDDAVVHSNSPSQLAHFGMVSRGNCWLSVEGKPDPLPLTGGDCFLLAPGSTYALRDDPRTRARSFCEVAPRNGGKVIHYGGGGVPTTIISGWFRFGQVSCKPLRRLLPDLILIKADQARTLALHATLQLLASEMAEPAPGSEVMVNRLADILFIQCVRAHIASSSETCKRGWLRGIFDLEIVEKVFKIGIGYDSKKVIDAVRGQVGIR